MIVDGELTGKDLPKPAQPRKRRRGVAEVASLSGMPLTILRGAASRFKPAGTNADGTALPAAAKRAAAAQATHIAHGYSAASAVYQTSCSSL